MRSLGLLEKTDLQLRVTISREEHRGEPRVSGAQAHREFI